MAGRSAPASAQTSWPLQLMSRPASKHLHTVLDTLASQTQPQRGSQSSRSSSWVWWVWGERAVSGLGWRCSPGGPLYSWQVTSQCQCQSWSPGTADPAQDGHVRHPQLDHHVGGPGCLGDHEDGPDGGRQIQFSLHSTKVRWKRLFLVTEPCGQVTLQLQAGRHVPGDPLQCHHAAVLHLHRGLALPPLRLLPQHALRGRLATRPHLRREVELCPVVTNLHRSLRYSLMNAICSFIGIYFNAKNRPHITLTKEEAKVNLYLF